MADNLGVDFALIDGDLGITSTGDFQIITNEDNVTQAVTNALFTEKGDIFYNSEYGFGVGVLIGEKNILAKRTLARNEIISLLQREPRIGNVEYVSVLQDENNPGRLNISFKATLINGEELVAENLTYPFVKPIVATVSIVSESQISTGIINVKTQYSIYNMRGVWLATDVNKTGTNYFTGGTISKDNITLGTNLPSTYSNVIIDYDTINAEYTSVKVTQIVDERKQSLDGTTIRVNYSVYDVSEIYNDTDEEKLINLADGATFAYNDITLAQSVPINDYFLVSYSTDKL